MHVPGAQDAGGRRHGGPAADASGLLQRHEVKAAGVQRADRDGMPGLVHGGKAQVGRASRVVASEFRKQIQHQHGPVRLASPPARAAHDALAVRPGQARGRQGGTREVLTRQVGAKMLAEDPLQGPAVREADMDVPVEASAAHQGGIQAVGVVARGQEHDALAPLNAVDLREQRVDDLDVPLAVAMGDAGAIGKRVDLVDEQQAGRLRPRVGRICASPAACRPGGRPLCRAIPRRNR